MARWAYPEGQEEMYEDIMKKRFIEAIAAPRLRRKLAELEGQSFQELVTRARRLAVILDDPELERPCRWKQCRHSAAAEGSWSRSLAY